MSGRNSHIRRPIVAIVSAGVVAAVLGACASNAEPKSSAASGTTAATPTTAAPITTAPTSAAAPTTADATSTSLSPGTALLADHHTWIAYQSNQTGPEGIWLIHPDGTENHNVAADVPGEEKYGNWSPDGTHLVFTTRGGETEPLYVYDLGLNTSEQLFQCNAPCLGDDEPVYSPDGAEVAFSRAHGPFVHDDATGNDVPTDCGLWIGDVATRAVHQITSNTDPPCDREYFPGWSPDGKHITYWRDPYANGAPTGTAVYTIDPDGTNETQLTDPTMNAGDPAWSPDGQWIVSRSIRSTNTTSSGRSPTSIAFTRTAPASNSSRTTTRLPHAPRSPVTHQTASGSCSRRCSPTVASCGRSRPTAATRS